MRAFVKALCLPVLFLTCQPATAQESVRRHGIEFDLPTGWTTKVEDDVFLLVPPKAKDGSRSPVEFALLFDPEIKDLGAEDLGEILDAAADDMLESAARKGTPAAAKFGTMDGRRYVYTGRDEDGRRAELRFHVFLGKDGAVALYSLGPVTALDARQEEFGRILDSLRVEGTAKPKRRAFGRGGQRGEAEDVVEEVKEEAKPEQGTNPLAPDRPTFTRIPGGVEVTWKGIALDIPADWTTQASEDGTLMLLPKGFGESGVLEEVYVLVGDGSLKALDAPDADAKIREGIDEIQPGLRPKGRPTDTKYGAVQGRTYVFSGQSPNGGIAEARVHAFPCNDGVGALLALGFATKLQARDTTVKAMLDSMRPVGKGKGDGAAVPSELAGAWSYLANVNATDGGGRTSQSILTLRADGTYSFRSETVSTNPLGAAWGNRNDDGRWQQQGQTLVFRSNNGESTSYRLEKRNHPRNNDPMIVLDGKAFVTVMKRAPW